MAGPSGNRGRRGSNTWSCFWRGFGWGAATLNLTNVTIAFNIGRGLTNEPKAIVNSSNALIVQNPGGDCLSKAGGAIFALFTNMDSDGSCPGFATGAAVLGPLSNNGGPTLTHLPAATSDAVDAGTDLVCQGLGNVDQRGYGRADVDGNVQPGDGNACDLGAIERGATPPPVGAYLPLILKPA